MKALLCDALRSLIGRRGATFVAGVGLLLAMTACLLVAMLALALFQPDPAIPNPEQVVLLDFKGNPPGRPSPWFTASPVSFATMLKERRVPLDLISRTSVSGLDINNRGRLQPAYLLIADPDLVPLLSLKALSGDVREALTRHDGIAITVDLVRKLWGDLPIEQAIGRRIDARGDADAAVFTVAAVIPNPDPRSPIWDPNPMVGNAMALVGFESQGNPMTQEQRNAIYMGNGRVFARLRPGVSVDPIGGWMREAFMENPLFVHLPAEWRTGREAAYFRGITLKQLPFEGAANELRWRLIAAVAAASTLLLLLAAFNCINLQTASLLQRQRETALRRSVGADAGHLWRLWGLEILLTLLLAAAGALLFAWWLAPPAGNWMGLSPAHAVGDPIPLSVLVGLAITVLMLLPLILAPSAWTALRRPPAPALQGRTASEGPWGRRIRQGLLTLQLCGALLLLSLTGALAVQQYHLLHVDRGFDTRNRLWLGVLMSPERVPNMDPFLGALDRHPSIKDWAFSDLIPASETQGRIELHVSSSQHKQVLRVSTVSPSFFETYGMTVLAGKSRVGSGEAHIVIDAKAVHLLGFSNPEAAIGQLLRGGGGFLQEGTDVRRIVAVVKDVKLESAREPAMPQGFLLTDKPQWNLSIHGSGATTLRQDVEALWKAYGPPLVYDIQRADDQRASVYRQEQQLTTMLAAVALLAVAVAMLGAYALVADTVRRRRTELVLHRLHGANDMAIARQVFIEFAAPLAISIAVGLPLAAWRGERYLAGFVDRVDFGTGIVLPSVAAGILMAIITAAAALRHLRQALALQPTEALR
jgi:putative ABC transport system permease protein